MTFFRPLKGLEETTWILSKPKAKAEDVLLTFF